MGKRNKKRVKNNRNILKLLGFTFIFAILIGFGIWKADKILFPEELTLGDSAKEFCLEKCQGKDIINSYNNTDYGFIRCRCVLKVSVAASRLGVHEKLETISLYFDSQTLKEISYDEALNRIKKK
jgi:hypothetical protein